MRHRTVSRVISVTRQWRDRESDDDQQDDEANRPIRNFEKRKDLRGDLNQEPAHNRIGHSYFVNIPPLQLGEEIIDPHC